MAEYTDRVNWRPSMTSKETLDDYWDKLLEKADYCDKEEFKFFVHCTTLKGKKRIMDSQKLIGAKTDLPARAPLASYLDMKGVWLAPSGKELPTRSPYGTQRLVFKVKDIMRFLGRDCVTADDSDEENEDKWDADEEEVDDTAKGKRNKKGAKRSDKKQQKKKQKNQKVNPRQKDCYLKHKVEAKVKLDVPLLFFECAHYYGNNQYVRLILIRASDPNVAWCQETCKELDIHHNPFLEFHFGRIWTYRASESGRHTEVTVEVLVAGDILFDKLPEPPDWDVVGTMSRAGFDPRLGVC